MTNDRPWPDGAATDMRTSGRVILLEAEDDVPTTTKPRLGVAGANCSWVHVVRGTVPTAAGHSARFLSLTEDIDDVVDLAKRIGGISMIVVSPITAYIPSQSRENQAVAETLHRLNRLTEQLKCAVVVTKHMSTTRTNVVPIERIAGPGPWADMPRTIVYVGDDPSGPDDRRVAFWLKHPGAALPEPLAFRIHRADNGMPAIDWLDEPVDYTSRKASTAGGSHVRSPQSIRQLWTGSSRDYSPVPSGSRT